MISVVLMALAGIAQSAMSYQQGRQAAQLAEDNADYNAKVAENQANQEALNRSAREREERRQHDRRIAAIESAYAKSGVLLEGTPATFLTEQVENDEMTVQRNNQASRQKQKSILNRAEMIRIDGANQSKAYKNKATGDLVGGLIGTAAGVGMKSAQLGGMNKPNGTSVSPSPFIGPLEMPEEIPSFDLDSWMTDFNFGEVK